LLLFESARHFLILPMIWSWSFILITT
jgi:hypothetical protein